MRCGKRTGIWLLAVTLLLGAFLKMPAYAAEQDPGPDVQVTRIKTNKKVKKVGKKIAVQLDFQSDMQINRVIVAYAGNGYATFKIRLKAVNPEKTRWKGSIPAKKRMKKGIWGIKRIYIIGKDESGKGIKRQIRNSRWGIESYEPYYATAQDLSAGNVKIAY